MMSRAVPWDEIATPEADYNVRLVPGARDIPCFWGKDTEGRNLFVVELRGHHEQQFSKDGLVLHGMSLDLRQGEEPGKERLVLTLEKLLDADLFLGLCETLVASLAPVSDSATAVSVTLNHLKRWKAFLAGRNARLLTPEEIRGLYAELLFLRLLRQRVLTDKAVVDAWSGPERVQQDFVFSDRAAEVKSVSGKDRSTVRISSEDQLETVAPHLFLVIYHLTDTAGDPPGESLNALVNLVEGELQDADASEDFQRKLAAFGYAPLPNYDTPTFVSSSSQAYRVTEAFPRLVRSSLPAGIARVSYQIELEAINPYKCALDDALGV
jgi:hypothetical protein